jgi:hypothetical protein
VTGWAAGARWSLVVPVVAVVVRRSGWASGPCCAGRAPGGGCPCGLPCRDLGARGPPLAFFSREMKRVDGKGKERDGCERRGGGA